MKKLIYKELSLATLPLTFIFLLFSLMTFIPGYPILCGAFFICLGMFQSWQKAREDNDILYSVLLPVKKSDVVKGKYAAAAVLQLTAFFLCAVFTFIRMFFLADAAVYRTNFMMSANIVFLAFVLLIFAAFNVIFIGGFFKTAYALGKPFVVFIAANFAIIAIAETLHHIPALSWLNAADFSFIGRHLIILAAAVFIYAVSAFISCRNSQKRFEAIDL